MVASLFKRRKSHLIKRRKTERYIISALLLMALLLCFRNSISYAAIWDNLETITVGVPTNRCPMIYEKPGSGEITGIGADILRVAAEDAGYNVIYKSIGDRTLKEALDDDQFDLVMPLGSAIQSAAGKDSVISESLIQTPMAFLTLDNKRMPELKNVKIGMLESQAGIAESISKIYYGNEIVFYEDMSKCVDALKKGEVDALLNNSYVWSYVLQKPAYSNLEIQPTVMINMDFRVGALDTYENREIIAKLNKGIRRLTDARKQSLVLEYTTKPLYQYDVDDYFYEYGYFLAVLLALALLVSLYVRQLRKAKKVAEDASNAKSAFLASMSHEIRTPINTIVGMGELISRETTDDTLKKYAYNINSSANSLLCLINDVLDYSKMEAGKLKIRDDPYKISNILMDLEIMIKDKAIGKGLAYEVVLDENMPDELVGDEIRIKQILINLLTNSVKYTKVGTITLSIKYEKVDDENIMLHMSVTDTGIGMKKEDEERLFDAFERFDEDKNKDVDGTGLGMSIVKKILTSMGGTIDVDSAYGEGTKITIALKQKVLNWKRIGNPVTFERRIDTEESYKPSFISPDARILSVDDTELNLKVITGLLDQTNVHIDSVLSGKEALEKTQKVKYDILLIDHRMPEMDGIELIKKIRKDSSNPNQKSICIALTANVLEGARDMYLKAGFDDYLEKPVKAKKLEGMIIKYLPEDKVLMTDKYIFFSSAKK